jgi:hypothetical protein
MVAALWGMPADDANRIQGNRCAAGFQVAAIAGQLPEVVLRTTPSGQAFACGSSLAPPVPVQFQRVSWRLA